MWTCQKCGEKIEDQFDSCWKCSRPKNAPVPPGTPPPPQRDWRMTYKFFRGTWASWDELFSQAAEFATSIGPEHLVTISHSCDQDDGVVTVWYWSRMDGGS